MSLLLNSPALFLNGDSTQICVPWISIVFQFVIVVSRKKAINRSSKKKKATEKWNRSSFLLWNNTNDQQTMLSWGGDSQAVIGIEREIYIFVLHLTLPKTVSLHQDHILKERRPKWVTQPQMKGKNTAWSVMLRMKVKKRRWCLSGEVKASHHPQPSSCQHGQARQQSHPVHQPVAHITKLLRDCEWSIPDAHQLAIQLQANR